jgi:hypothetical protein
MSLNDALGQIMQRIAATEQDVAHFRTIEVPASSVEVPIFHYVVPSAVAAIDVVQIPQTGRRLVVRWALKSDAAAANTDILGIRFSSTTSATPTPDTGANYCYTFVRGNNGVANGGNGILGTYDYIGLIGGATSPSAAYLSAGHLEIPNYADAASLRMFTTESYHHGTTSIAASYRDSFGCDWHGGAIYQLRLFMPSGANISVGVVDVSIGG